MKVIVAGSRTITNMRHVSDAIRESGFKPTVIISGGALGVDMLGEVYADAYDIQKIIIEANWDLYGKRAGYIRNCKMASIADALIAVWDGKSKGTCHMIEEAQKRRLKVYVHRIESH